MESSNGKHNEKESLVISKQNVTTVILNLKDINRTDAKEAKCLKSLMDVILLMNDDDLTESQYSDIFFCVTKLFQKPNNSIRRMVYFILSAAKQNPSTAFMAINVLLKDLTDPNSTPNRRANAIKTLSHILDKNTAIDNCNHIRQGLVNTDESVRGAALLAGIRLYRHSPSIIRIWSQDAKDSLSSEKNAVQLAALVLFLKTVSGDNGRYLRVLDSTSKNSSSLSQALVLHALGDHLKINSAAELRKAKDLSNFLVSSLKSGQDFILYEALRVVCDVFDPIPAGLLNLVIIGLQSFLVSFNTTKKFTALKILEKHFSKLKNGTQQLTSELKRVCEENNKTLASNAMNILLKMGDENELGILLPKLEESIVYMQEESKIKTLNNLNESCRSKPQLQNRCVELFWAQLKDDPSLKIKKFALTYLSEALQNNCEHKDKLMEDLCDFLENSSHQELTLQILHLLSEQGVNSEKASSFVRCITNRITLELPHVRCAAVDALYKFAVNQPNLKGPIKVIIKRCSSDEDEQVRCRAETSLYLLEHKDVIFNEIDKNIIDDLEYSIKNYIEGDTSQPFEISSLQSAPKKEIEPETQTKEILVPETFEEQHQNEFFKQSDFISLTEIESEYCVHLRKLIYNACIVLEFTVENTIENNALQNISVCLTQRDFGLQQTKQIGIDELKYGERKSLFILLERSVNFPLGSFPCKLLFSSKIKGRTVSDEYSLEDVIIELNDFSGSLKMDIEEFKSHWKDLEAFQKVESIEYQRKSVDTNRLIEQIGGWMGMDVMNFASRGNIISIILTAKMSRIENEIEILARANVKIDKNHRVNATIAFRCKDQNVVQIIIEKMNRLK